MLSVTWTDEATVLSVDEGLVEGDSGVGVTGVLETIELIRELEKVFGVVVVDDDEAVAGEVTAVLELVDGEVTAVLGLFLFEGLVESAIVGYIGACTIATIVRIIDAEKRQVVWR